MGVGSAFAAGTAVLGALHLGGKTATTAQNEPTPEMIATAQRAKQLAAIRQDAKATLDKLPPGRVARLEQENVLLQKEIDSMSQDVALAERRVTEIAKLQRVLSEKIEEQAEKIEQVHHTAVEATENVEMGNKHLRQSRESSQRFRWIVFGFLLFCSLMLLIFDWSTRS